MLLFGDKKPDFFQSLADWFESWQDIQASGCEKFTLTKQTCYALIVTHFAVRATAALIELDEEIYSSEKILSLKSLSDDRNIIYGKRNSIFYLIQR